MLGPRENVASGLAGAASRRPEREQVQVSKTASSLAHDRAAFSKASVWHARCTTRDMAQLRSSLALCFLTASSIAVAAACSSSSASPNAAAPGDDASSAEDGSNPAPPTDASTDRPVAPEGTSAGCVAPAAGYPAGTTAATVTTAGGARTFRVHVPPSYVHGKAMPVVLMLHGGGGSALQFETQSAKMDPVADREGFITVYPDGVGVIKTFNAGNCCGKAVADKVDDVGFVAALLDHVEAKLCVDERRVFASGMSNGALMSHRLACELSSRIAAIAPVAGTMPIPTCEPARPVPVFEIHGTNDGHVPFAGGMGCGPSKGVDFTSVPVTIEGWRTRNGCEATTLPSFTQGDGTCAAYQGCKSPVVLCTIEGGGHSWPGGDPKVAATDCPEDGFQSTTFLASEAIWKFFAANPMTK